MKANRICELIGIRYPIIQAPMNWVSGANLTAAVSRAGGLGALGPNAGAETITADVERTGTRMREQIREVKERTDKPFAVNITVGVGEDRKYSQKIVEVVVEEHVPVAVVSVGSPDVYTEVLKDAGITVLHAISTARHAKKAEACGVDAVICEGFEAGGHKGFTELTTLVLIPMVADAVNIPVIAGGGIGDARGVLAALALGADGAYMGSRFMVSRESDSHPRVKESVVRAEGACTVALPKEYMLARDLSNAFTAGYLEMRAKGASAQELQEYLNAHSQYLGQHLGDVDGGEVCCGQVAGLIESVKGAGEIIDDIAAEMHACFEELKERMKVFL